MCLFFFGCEKVDSNKGAEHENNSDIEPSVNTVIDLTEETKKNEYVVSDALQKIFPDDQLIIGDIDENFYLKIKETSLSSSHDFVIVSRGGYIFQGLKIAEILRQMKNTITIVSICESACAEFILPAAHKLVFWDEPIIGFHLNAISDVELLAQKTGNPERSCSYALAQKSRELYEHTGVKADFWKVQYKYLGEVSVDFIAHDDCDEVIVRNSVEMWYPSSQQLREHFGLKFEGSVCADSIDCINDKILRAFPKKSKIAVGKDYYEINK